MAHLFPVGGLISIPAGLKRMHVRWFALYTVLGCALWNGTFVVLGWALGGQWVTVQGYASIVERATLIALAGVILWFLRGRWKARNRSGR